MVDGKRRVALLAGMLAPLCTVLVTGPGAAGTGAAAGGAGAVTAGGVDLPAPGAVPAGHKVHRRQTVLTGSYNWSGYTEFASANDTDAPVRTGTYTAVEDSWTVPTVTPKGIAYSSDWVGIGGVSDTDPQGYQDDTLVQAGTEADSHRHKTVYQAWTELLPAAETVLPGITVHPGDHMTVVVEEVATNEWRTTVTDVTRGTSQSTTYRTHVSGASAEAVHERPEVGSHLAKLAVTTPATFTPGFYSTSAPGSPTTWTPLLDPGSDTTLLDMVMVTVKHRNVVTLATPSGASTDDEGFTVADGSATPRPPSS